MVHEFGMLPSSCCDTHRVADIGVDRNYAFREGLTGCLDRHPICDTGPAVYMDE